MASALLPAPSASSGVDFIYDDSSEDACCICLEPFSSHDPPNVTKCKHEYHLHCILEWSQRSSECPICSQHLILKDPASQELLAGAESDMDLKLRRNIHPVNVERDVNNMFQDIPHVINVCDTEQQITRRFAAIASRARNFSIRRRQTDFAVGPLQINPSGTVLTNMQNGTQVNSSTSSDLAAFSESVKAKISTASAKYKESISNSTRGLKEKLAAHNGFVKEMSRGVQREMKSGIAGFAKIIERRLDNPQKQGGVSVPISCSAKKSSNSPCEAAATSMEQSTFIGSQHNQNTHAENAHDDMRSVPPFITTAPWAV